MHPSGRAGIDRPQERTIARPTASECLATGEEVINLVVRRVDPVLKLIRLGRVNTCFALARSEIQSRTILAIRFSRRRLAKGTVRRHRHPAADVVTARCVAFDRACHRSCTVGSAPRGYCHLRAGADLSVGAGLSAPRANLPPTAEAWRCCHHGSGAGRGARALALPRRRCRRVGAPSCATGGRSRALPPSRQRCRVCGWILDVGSTARRGTLRESGHRCRNGAPLL